MYHSCASFGHPNDRDTGHGNSDGVRARWDTRAVEDILSRKGFERSFYRRTPIWQVVVYTR